MIHFGCILMLMTALLVRADSVADRLTAGGIAEFTAAYQAWDGARFETAAQLFRQASTRTPETAASFYWLGVAEFHRTLQLNTQPTNSAAAARTLDTAVADLNTALRLDSTNPETHALLGTLYGMKINGNPLRAVWFGPRLVRHRARALEFGMDNPRVQYLLGMCQFHMAGKPEAWSEALATLQRAEKLFNAESKSAPAPLAPRWGHDSCLTFIGRTCESLGRRTEAVDYFHRALALHPGDSVALAGLERLRASK